MMLRLHMLCQNPSILCDNCWRQMRSHEPNGYFIIPRNGFVKRKRKTRVVGGGVVVGGSTVNTPSVSVLPICKYGIFRTSLYNRIINNINSVSTSANAMQQFINKSCNAHVIGRKFTLSFPAQPVNCILWK